MVHQKSRGWKYLHLTSGRIFRLVNGIIIYINKLVGADDVEGTPVPIPNTAVKLNNVEDTWLVTVWKNR